MVYFSRTLLRFEFKLSNLKAANYEPTSAPTFGIAQDFEIAIKSIMEMELVVTSYTVTE